ncbi:TPA: hypothetical protein QB352_001099 [Pasteurella multocida]|nr:hypothetical protein [Pasteurella multocida]
MKKITQLSLAALLAFTLAACDNAGKTSSNTDSAKKTEVQLSPQEQFRHDYEKVEKWRAESDKEMNKHFSAFETKMAEAQSSGKTKPEDIDKLFAPFTEATEKLLKALDELNLKDPEVIKYTLIIKEAYRAATTALPMMAKATLDPLNAVKELSKVEAKFKEFEQAQQAVETEGALLKQKYEQK